MYNQFQEQWRLTISAFSGQTHVTRLAWLP